MNDSKWCRLLEAIASLNLRISYWRFVHSDNEYKIPTPSPDLIVEQNGKRGIGDYDVLGPFFFVDVLSVRWPTKYFRNWAAGYEPLLEQQPIQLLRLAIDRCGKFDYEIDDDGLILYAYRKKT